MNAKSVLEAALGETSLRWDCAKTPKGILVVWIYYPSEEAFYASCSKRKGGTAQTEEGERIKREARRIRATCLKVFPNARIGFDIESEAAQ